MHWQMKKEMWVSEGLNTDKNEQREWSNTSQHFWQATYPAGRDTAVAGMVSLWVLQWEGGGALNAMKVC